MKMLISLSILFLSGHAFCTVPLSPQVGLEPIPCLSIEDHASLAQMESCLNRMAGLIASDPNNDALKSAFDALFDAYLLAVRM